MKTIKIKFTDFWDNFVPENSLFYRLLNEKYNIEISDTPDYLFYSVFGQEHLKYNCIKIFYTGENQSPDFNLCDYAIGFDPLEYGDRYFRFPYFYLGVPNLDTFAFNRPAPDNRQGFCSFVYSNNYASPEREQMLALLNTYKEVASGGRYKNNVGGPVPDKIAFLKNYKFNIAFENVSQSGYTTEKLLNAFEAGAIPVYWGDPRVAETFNPKAFINCHAYASFQEVLEKIKEIDGNEALYREMLAQPILLHKSDKREPKLKALQEFLYNIFDQDPTRAQRFSRFYWQARYRNNLLSRDKAYNRSPKGFAQRFYKRYIWKYRRNSKILWAIDRLAKRFTLKR